MATKMNEFHILELQQVEIFLKQIIESPPSTEASGIFRVNMSILTTVWFQTANSIKYL